MNSSDVQGMCTETENINKNGLVLGVRSSPTAETFFGVGPAGTTSIRGDSRDVKVGESRFFLLEGVGAAGASLAFSDAAGRSLGEDVKLVLGPGPDEWVCCMDRCHLCWLARLGVAGTDVHHAKALSAGGSTRS